jgi:hypothetical protein
MIAPSQSDGVVVLINMDEVDASALAADLMKIVLGATASDPKIRFRSKQ